MLIRLLDVLLFAGLAGLLLMALLSPAQRAGLHKLFNTVALALLLSSLLILAISLARIY